MNSAKTLKFLEDFIRYIAAVVAISLKPFPGLYRFFPSKKMQSFLKSWDMTMLVTYVGSLGKRAYIDQRGTLPVPTHYKPLVETDEKYRLSEDQIRSFYENGFLGPFTLCSPKEMAGLREEVHRQITTVSDLYGHVCGRDRHLDCKAVQDLIMRPKIAESLAQLLGADLCIWRSQVVCKEPGAPEVTWHQANTYLMEEIYKPTLFPPSCNELFQLTTWIAFDDTDLENGCLQFIPGTHYKINTMSLGGKDSQGFVNAKIKLDVEIDPKTVFSAEMKAGQFIIFSERVIHGSPPNISDRRRWGMTFRTIKPEVKVYDDELIHTVAYLEKGYDLSKWGGLMIRGQDRIGVNRLYQTPATDKASEPSRDVENSVLWT